MRTPNLTTLLILAAMAGPAMAQEDTTETDTMAEEVMDEMIDAVEEMADDVEDATTEDMADDTMADDGIEDTMSDDAMSDDAMEDTMSDDTMSDDTMADDASEDAMTDDVMEDEAPSLEEIAASDPDLEMREGEDGEADAMVMLSDVLFSFGDASLEPAALDVLAGIGAKLDGVTSLEITGHTDSVGTEEFNLALGQRRADAVRDWLIANTPLTAEVITARGVGEAEPIADNRTADGADNPDGRALNRRVEFTLPDAG